ncbi:MAG: phage portal protein, partial [Planctomycetota bacterium]
MPKSTKKVPFIWPAWVNNQPQWQLVNYEAYAQEGFNANAVIYSAIMYKVRSITSAPLRAYTGTKEEPELLPPEHPLQALCLRPNRFQSWSEFQALATVYFNLSGNCYIVLEREDDQITAMYLLRPDRVFIIPTANRDQLIGFWYVPEGKAWQEGKPYLPQDTIHVKLPNPLDPLDGLGYGVSPLSPAAQSGDVDNDITKFLRLFFKQGAMPPGVLSFDVPMMDDDVSRARERWMEVYGGYENWTDVAVLDQGGKYERVGFTFEEMDVSALDARNESRIVAPFGVPLNLIESRPELVQSTYSNKAEDRTMFWQDTMIPELKWFETDYQYYLQADDAFVMFDTSGVPALTMTESERLDRFQKAFETGAVTVDEHRAELGLDPLPEMEMELQQPSPTGQQETEDGQPEAEEQAEEDEDKAKKKDIDRVGFWRKADQLAVDFEAEFGDAAVASFEEDRRNIAAIIDDNNREALAIRASLNWGAVQEDISRYLTTNAVANWQRHFTLPLHTLMTDRINDLNQTLHKSKQRPVTAAELLIQDWFDEYTIQFAQPI